MRNRETKASNIVLCFDGGASPNPGKGAWAAVLYFGTPTLDPRAQRDQDELGRGVGDLGGGVSNNYAEYCALIGGLRLVEETLRDSVPLRSVAVAVLGDSQLVINQMTGVFSVRDPSLRILNAIASSLVDKFRSVTFNHIDRKYNTVADSMANTQINKTTYSGAIPYYPNLMLASTLTIDNIKVIASNDLGAGFSECINMIDAKFLRDCLPVQGGLRKFWKLHDAGASMRILSGNGFTAPILGTLPSLAVHLHPFFGEGNETRPLPFLLENVLVVDGLPVPLHITYHQVPRGFIGTVRMNGSDDVRMAVESFPVEYHSHRYWTNDSNDLYLPYL